MSRKVTELGRLILNIGDIILAISEGESQLSTSSHHSLLPNCGGNVLNHSTILLWYHPCQGELHPPTVSKNKLSNDGWDKKMDQVFEYLGSSWWHYYRKVIEPLGG